MGQLTYTTLEVQAILDKADKAATTTANGLMSSTDKVKLDGIATGANNYTHPAYISKTSGLYKIAVDATGHVSAATAVAKTDITGLGIPAQDTTYQPATTSAAGLMSAADKTRSDYNYGSNAVTTLASLPITKKLVIATLSEATSLSLATDMEVGQELYIRCVPSAAFTQPIPNSGVWTSMSGSSITTVSGTPFEISILCYATDYYSIVVKTKD